MENILLLVLRDIRKHTPESVAFHLGISLTEYLRIESGTQLMTEEQAEQLGKLFNVKSRYVYKSALQVELLMIRNEMLQLQSMKIDELKQKIRELERARRGLRGKTDGKKRKD